MQPFRAFIIVVVSFVVCSLAAAAITTLCFAQGINSGDFAQILTAQSISSVMMFALPALITAKMLTGKLFQPFCGGAIGVRMIIISAVAMALVQPLVEWSSFVNEYVCALPRFAEYSFDKMLKADARIIAIMLSPNDLPRVVLGFVVVALLPAVCEELFFRATLQRAMISLTDNPVVGVVLSALIFSAMHLEPTGLLPRFVLGCLLGTIYYMSANIWLPIAAHAVNNAASIVMVKYVSEVESIENAILAPADDPGTWLTILSLTATFIAMRTLHMLILQKNELQSAER